MILVVTLIVTPSSSIAAESTFDIDVEGETFYVGMADPTVDKEDIEISSKLSFTFEDDEQVIITDGIDEIDASYTVEEEMISVTVDDEHILDIVEIRQEPLNDSLYYATISNLYIENEEVMRVVEPYLIKNAIDDQLVLFYQANDGVDIEEIAGNTFDVGAPDPTEPVSSREISSNFTFAFDETDGVTITRGAEEILGKYSVEDGILNITYEDGETQILDIVEFVQEESNEPLYYATMKNINLDNEEVAHLTRDYLIYNKLQDQFLLFYNTGE